MMRRWGQNELIHSKKAQARGTKCLRNSRLTCATDHPPYVPRGYAEAAQLLRAAPTPSPQRVRFLADHIDFAIAALHIHHESEDELLYPKLIQRVPEQAPMTEEVEHEHQLVRTALDTASAACATWRGRPSAETGEALAAALDQLNTVAQRHLDDEEQDIVPLAAVTLTAGVGRPRSTRARPDAP